MQSSNIVADIEYRPFHGARPMLRATGVLVDTRSYENALTSAGEFVNIQDVDHLMLTANDVPLGPSFFGSNRRSDATIPVFVLRPHPLRMISTLAASLREYNGSDASKDVPEVLSDLSSDPAMVSVGQVYQAALDKLRSEDPDRGRRLAQPFSEKPYVIESSLLPQLALKDETDFPEQKTGENTFNYQSLKDLVKKLVDMAPPDTDALKLLQIVAQSAADAAKAMSGKNCKAVFDFLAKLYKELIQQPEKKDHMSSLLKVAGACSDLANLEKSVMDSVDERTNAARAAESVKGDLRTTFIQAVDSHLANMVTRQRSYVAHIEAMFTLRQGAYELVKYVRDSVLKRKEANDKVLEKVAKDKALLADQESLYTKQREFQEARTAQKLEAIRKEREEAVQEKKKVDALAMQLMRASMELTRHIEVLDEQRRETEENLETTLTDYALKLTDVQQVRLAARNVKGRDVVASNASLDCVLNLSENLLPLGSPPQTGLLYELCEDRRLRWVNSATRLACICFSRRQEALSRCCDFRYGLWKSQLESALIISDLMTDMGIDDGDGNDVPEEKTQKLNGLQDLKIQRERSLGRLQVLMSDEQNAPALMEEFRLISSICSSELAVPCGFESYASYKPVNLKYVDADGKTVELCVTNRVVSDVNSLYAQKVKALESKPRLAAAKRYLELGGEGSDRVCSDHRLDWTPEKPMDGVEKPMDCGAHEAPAPDPQ